MSISVSQIIPMLNNTKNNPIWSHLKINTRKYFSAAWEIVRILVSVTYSWHLSSTEFLRLPLWHPAELIRKWLNVWLSDPPALQDVAILQSCHIMGGLLILSVVTEVRKINFQEKKIDVIIFLSNAVSVWKCGDWKNKWFVVIKSKVQRWNN